MATALNPIVQYLNNRDCKSNLLPEATLTRLNGSLIPLEQGLANRKQLGAA